MKELVVKMVDVLKKEKGLTLHKIERDLGFSNGLLGKAVEGKSKLSDEKVSKLGQYYFQKTTEGKPLGYIKLLENGEVETGVTYPENLEPPKKDLSVNGKEPKFDNEVDKILWELEQDFLKTKNKKQ